MLLVRLGADLAVFASGTGGLLGLLRFDATWAMEGTEAQTHFLDAHVPCRLGDGPPD
jgi:hypothetical protein